MKALVVILSLISVSAFANVDLTKSEFKWRGDKVVTGGHEGTVALKSAELTLDKDVIKSGTFVIDLNTIVVTDIKDASRATRLADHLKNDDFFNVPSYPTATLNITKVEGTKVTGDLTVKGKTHPVTFEIKRNGKEFTGSLVFNRTQYGVNYASGNIFKDLAADKIIKDEIKIDFKVVQK
jgi:polyisoprenoid-binding protein YceI